MIDCVGQYELGDEVTSQYSNSFRSKKNMIDVTVKVTAVKLQSDRCFKIMTPLYMNSSLQLKIKPSH